MNYSKEFNDLNETHLEKAKALGLSAIYKRIRKAKNFQ